MSDPFENHCWRDLVPDDLVRLYAPYRRETGIGARPALLLIDVYELAFEGGRVPPLDLLDRFPSSCGLYAWDALPHLSALLRAARAAKIPVLHATVDVGGLGVPGAAMATKRPTRLDAKGFAFRSEVSPAAGELIIAKQRASVFFGTAMTTHLTRLGVGSLIVAGQSTSGCVRASVVDAYSHGYHVAVVEEACFDRHLWPHKAALFDLHHKYADVVRIGDVVAHLGRECVG